MENSKAVLFDLDGTLIDSEYFYFSNWAPILASEFGVVITFEDWILYFAGHTLLRNIGMMKDQFGIDTNEEFMMLQTRANYAKANMIGIALMPGVLPLLESLKAKGVHMGLVTSSFRSTVDTVLGHHGLLGYFEFFVTRELVTHPKPNAEPYLLGLSKLGLAAHEVIAIEDTITGCQAAQAAGIYCVAVSKHITERNRLQGADLLIGDLHELPSTLF